MAYKSKDSLTLVIKENAFFKGSLNTPGSVKISGNYQGKIYSNENVYVDATAKIDGDIEAENIVISGYVKGNIIARNKIHLTSTSKLIGQIIAKGFSIEKGGFFDGNCKYKPNN